MYKIFSVDDHIIEPADLWTSRLPARFHDQGPHVVEDDGREFWEFEGRRSLTMGLNAVAGWPRDQWSMEPARFSDMIPGCYDPKERARDLLSQGVFASVNFPTLPRFAGVLFNEFEDKTLADLCVKAWNDFVLDEWCPAGPPGLFVPMIICQLWDPSLAAAEVRRCAEKGARALSFIEHPAPAGLPGFHSHGWDPLWAAVQECDVAVCMHIVSSGFVPLLDPQAGFLTATSGGHINGMLALTELSLGHIPRDFPGIKLVFSEAGIGWVPAILERCDRQWDRHEWSRSPSDLSPSEVFHRNMFCCMVEEPVGLSMHALIGEDNILAETDYPHSDTTYPRVQEAFDVLFDGIPDRVVQKVCHENAERVFRWEMASPDLFDDAEVASWRKELDKDPHAGMKLRQTPASHATNVAGGSSAGCTALVWRDVAYERCGAPLGDDRMCPDGHAAGALVGLR